MRELPKIILDRIENYCVKKKFTDSKKKKLIEIVTNRYNDSLVTPGDAIGLIAAQSIGEPGTQLTLRTKHYAGSLEVSVGQGIQRVIEIVDGRLNAKYPSMKIYLNKDFFKNDKQINKFVNSLIDIKVKDIGHFEEDFENRTVSFISNDEKILELDLNKEEVMTLVYDKIDDIYASKRFTPNKNGINFVFDKSTSLYEIRKSLLKWEKIPLFGIKSIEKVVIIEENGEKVIVTKGSNLSEILKLEEIDLNRTVTNDINEINKVLGIEAARESIVRELYYTFKANGISLNKRHIYVLADLMCASGKVKGIVRTGITGHKNSPFARASFEETVKHILNASFYGEIEPLTGITENMIVGQPISSGTGNIKLTLDPKHLKKMIKKQEKLIEKEE
ncbi:MAG: DNA-directed RNA polymerase subunit A'' [Candidatus ainarchaeum sp.]|nr:DNA-directed RNA polymerase subunit A'' [Candidatus ainarchaeum sp.]